MEQLRINPLRFCATSLFKVASLPPPTCTPFFHIFAVIVVGAKSRRLSLIEMTSGYFVPFKIKGVVACLVVASAPLCGLGFNLKDYSCFEEDNLKGFGSYSGDSLGFCHFLSCAGGGRELYYSRRH
ncbi:MAG: hypothetical protein ACI35Q_02240 [Marinilabiliaceae bacterium]